MLERYLKFRASLNNSALVRAMLNEAKLLTVWEYLSVLNPSSAGRNYHSSRHMLEVWAIACWIAESESIKLDKNIQLACLMHDYDHSLGKFDDDHNIERACAGVDKVLADYPGLNLEKIKVHIRKTRFPFLSENDPQTLDEACLRDADLLYAMTEGDDRIKILTKLLLEVGRKEFVMGEALREQTEFWRSCVMYTETGRRIQRYFTDLQYTGNLYDTAPKTADI